LKSWEFISRQQVMADRHKQTSRKS
jgi:hypothetical protein